jgi:hypothetical protein
MKHSRLARWILSIIAAPIILWSGYWAAAAYAFEQGAHLALREAHKSGVSTQFQEISVQGYPTEFEMGVSDISVSVENTFTWETQKAVLHTASFKPNEINLDLSETHQIDGSFGTTTITTKQAKLSVLFHPSLLIPLGKIALHAEDMAIDQADGFKANLGSVFATVTSYADPKEAYNLAAKLDNIHLGSLWPELPPAYQSVQALRLNSDVLFDAAWDRTAMSRGLPALQKTVLNEIRFDFGDANILATGQLIHEATFGPTGQINLIVQGWQSLFELAKSLGYVAPNLEDMFFTLLTDLAAQTDSSDTITLPLTLQNGRVSYGALTVGTLPKSP